MINTLRKRHRNVWLGIALLIPIALIMAVTSTPKFPVDNWLNSEVLVPASILKEYQLPGIKVNLRGEENKVQVLEIALLVPLKSASSEVIIVNNQEQSVSLGQIGATGVYHFKLNGKVEDWKTLKINDYIKNEEINSISLQ